MNATIQSGFNDWLPRRLGLQVAAGLWAAGFVLGGAAAWRMHHDRPSPETFDTAGVSASTSIEAPADLEGVLVLPEDVLTAHRAPSMGAAMKQKP